MNEQVKIIYEDNHLIVAIKPPGVLSQADYTGDKDMVNILKEYIKEKYHKPGKVYLGLVHRLDRMTGGLMVFAKTSKAAKRLSEQIRNNEFTKKYLAIVEGGFNKTSGEFSDYLSKDEKEVKSYIDNKKGKLAVLKYDLVEQVGDETLISVELITGRHHQIRVQFASRGYPIVGDRLYASKNKEKMMLYAYYLKIKHPTTNIELEFTHFPSGGKWDEFEVC